MRVDPFYVTNLVGSLDQAQSSVQQLTAELSSGVRIAERKPRHRPVAGGRLCPGQRRQ